MSHESYQDLPFVSILIMSSKGSLSEENKRVEIHILVMLACVCRRILFPRHIQPYL